MYTVKSIIEHLLIDPTERGLSEMNPRPGYCVIPSSLGNFNAIGYVAIEVFEGLLLIPFNQVQLGNGWEQLVLEQRAIVPLPVDWHGKRRAFEESLQVLEATLPSITLGATAIHPSRTPPQSDAPRTSIANTYRKTPHCPLPGTSNSHGQTESMGVG